MGVKWEMLLEFALVSFFKAYKNWTDIFNENASAYSSALCLLLARIWSYLIFFPTLLICCIKFIFFFIDKNRIFLSIYFFFVKQYENVQDWEIKFAFSNFPFTASARFMVLYFVERFYERNMNAFCLEFRFFLHSLIFNFFQYIFLNHCLVFGFQKITFDKTNALRQ